MMYGDGFFAFHAATLIPFILFGLPFAIGFISSSNAWDATRCSISSTA